MVQEKGGSGITLLKFCFNSFIFACVICPAEKSNTSSLKLMQISEKGKKEHQNSTKDKEFFFFFFFFWK
jgi:hypothetical protein